MLSEVVFDYYYGDESDQFSYFRIPRLLIVSPQFKRLSTDAKLLYGMLLDRMSLSVKNGWYDDQGRVYIYYTVDEIQEDLNCGKDKAIKLLAELDTKKGVGLIERRKQGQGKPTKLYVKRFTTGATPRRPMPQDPPLQPTFPGARGADLDFSDFQTSDFPTSRPRESRCADFGKADLNYNNLNQTDFSHPDLSIYPPVQPDGQMDRFVVRERTKEQIDYQSLKQKYPFDDVSDLLELIVDTMTSTAPTIRIGGEPMPATAVKNRFQQLDSTHIEYVLEALKKTTTEIRNIRAYLLTALYNAPVTIGSYYSAAVRHDYG